MNIAIAIRRLNIGGGAQRMVAHAAKKFRDAGHIVTIYTFFYSPEDCYPEILKDFKVVVADEEAVALMKSTSAKRGIAGFIKNFLNENRAARNLAHKIDPATDVFNPHDHLVYRMSRYIKKEVKNIPSVWMLDDMPTKKHSFLRNAQFDASLRLPLAKRLWYWVYDSIESYQFLRFQDSIAVVDTRDKKWAEEAFGRKTVIVRNGLDIQEFPYTPRTGVSGKKIHLFALAILLPHRRFEDCIEATAILRERGFDATLSIAGEAADAGYLKKLQKTVGELQLESSVSFLGKISYQKLLELYATADFFVFPAHLQSWGLVVFEAMASGQPVIVSETSGASEVLHNGETAMIVPPYAPQSIADAAERLAEDAAEYRKVSAQGREFVEKEISWDRYAQELLNLFEDARRNYE